MVTSQKTRNKRKQSNSNSGGTIFVLLIGIAAYFMFFHNSDSLEKDPLSNFDVEAITYSKISVKEQLNYPSSSVFHLNSVSYSGKGLYIVSGTVEASNAFGVKKTISWKRKIKMKSKYEYNFE